MKTSKKNRKKVERRKYLESFRNKVHSGFLAAILNEEVKKEINHYRKVWGLHGKASTSTELEDQIRRLFLRDAGLVDGAKIGGSKIEREGNRVYKIDKAKNGRETRWLLPNPFYITDGHKILVPENKERLIKILANIENNKKYLWIFEPRLQAVESEISYPSSHILIDTLHKTSFLKGLRLFILGECRLDYFLHWHLFFYYILTGNVNWVMKNIGDFVFFPYCVFVVHDDSQDSWLIKSYGNADISILQNFIQNNKAKLKELTDLLNNPNVSGASPSGLMYVLESREGERNRVLAIKDELKDDESDSEYLRIMKNQARRTGKMESSHELKNNPVLEDIEEAENRVKVYKSRGKKLVEKIAEVEGFSPRIQQLVDEINDNW